MQKKTRSLLEELDSMYIERDQRHVIENRASTYSSDDAQNLQRKLINAISQRDPGKFTRTVRRTDANS
jgi:hypothetical protein